MVNPNRVSKPDIEKSEQELLNKSFDREFDVLAFENLAFNPVTNSLERVTRSLTAGKDYDYIDAQQTSASVETYVFKLGGSGGTTVQTITVNYTDATKTNLDTIAYS